MSVEPIDQPNISAGQQLPIDIRFPENELQAPHLSETDPRIAHLAEFSGNGKEYFKIWIVNLCLTLMTFGIYSAWAKVRRLQYFDRNTHLAGATFNFHGDPKVILRGRIVAAILLFLYHYVFGLSKNFAIGFAVLLFLGLPWMMRSALRFRLRNTSYRGLRFDFDGKLSQAYATYLPIAVIFILPALIAVLFPLSWYIGIPGILYLLWPWLHVRMKRYQHSNFAYGQKHARAELKTGAFVWSYFLTAVYILIAVIVAGVIAALSVSMLSRNTNANDVENFSTWLIPILTMTVVCLLLYSVLGPFLQTKIWNICWNNTQLDEIKFKSNLPVWGYTKLQCINALLTIFSLGLYRPFAVVRSYQFRLQHMEVRADETDFDTQNNQVQSENATAESSAEFLGFDLSW